MAGKKVMEREQGSAAADGVHEAAAHGESDWREAAVDRVASAILDNRLRHDGSEVCFEPVEARRLAAEIVRYFLDADPKDYPFILDAAGFKFVLEELSYYPGFDHDVLHVLLWSGSRWATVEEVPLPPLGSR
ncbi:MAG TPA: hypothetical protein VF282_03095 [Bacillota bacterium]